MNYGKRDTEKNKFEKKRFFQRHIFKTCFRREDLRETCFGRKKEKLEKESGC